MPDLSTIPSGLHAAFTDAREFLQAVRFARPWWLLLSGIPVAILLLRIALTLRRRGTAALPWETVVRLRTGPRGRNWLAQLSMTLAWSLLVAGVAGPQWGQGDDGGVAVGRDLVIVLDLSRSMLAEDMAGPPARWQAAAAGVLELLESLRGRGGHRVALVIFAGRAKLLVPLTTDYDHVQSTLRDLDGTHPPAEIRPPEDAKSGTRIGAALAAAVAAHDKRFPGSQDILLVSDGDDPANDREWSSGVSAARAASIPVHAVGVGDPTRTSPVVINGQFLEFATQPGVPDPVQTKLNEAVLTGIATEGRGHYLPARRDVPKLGEFFRTRIAPFPSRELTDDALPQPRDRSVWFLGFGVVLLAVAWIFGR